MASSLGSRVTALQLTDNEHRAVGFLDLALELRQRIYRCLLLEGDALIQAPNPVFEEPTHTEPCIAGLPDLHGGPATIQGVNPWIETVDLSIFEVNSQIREEVRSFLFSEELHWVCVSINSKGFSHQLRDAGFPVFFRRSFDRILKPALKLKVEIESLNPLRQHDSFVLDETAMQKLMRALNLTRDKYDISISFDFQPISLSYITRNHDYIMSKLMRMLGAAEALRGIRKSVVRGIPPCLEFAADYSKVAVEVMQGPDDLDTLLPDHASVQQTAEFLCALERWVDAEGVYLSILAALTGLRKTGDIVAYRSLLVNPSGTSTFVTTCFSMASALAFVQHNLGNFQGAINRATYALTAAGISQKDRGMTLYRRGLSHAALKHYLAAASDFIDAQRLMPGDRVIAEALEKLGDRLGEVFPMSANPLDAAKQFIKKNRGAANVAQQATKE